MTDHGDDDSDRHTRPRPTRGHAVVTNDLPPGQTGDPVDGDGHPAIESTLVGDGDGRPAASPRFDGADDDVATAEAASAVDPPSDASLLTIETSSPEPWDRTPPSDGPRDDVKSAVERPDETPDETVAAIASPAPVPARPTPRRGGFWPALLGGVIAAGLGAGAMYFALDGLPEPVAGLSPDAETTVRTIATQAAGDAVQSRAASLQDEARAAGTEAAEAVLAAAAPAPAVDPSALDQQAARIAAVEAQLKTLTDRPNPPAPTSSAAANAVPVGTPASPDAIAALRADLEAQAARIAELAARPTLDPAAVEEVRRLAADAAGVNDRIAAVAADVEGRVATARTQADEVTAKLDETARRVQSTAALAALETALVNGSDGATAPARLQAAGVEAPAALSRPIPALTDLQRDFADASRAGLRAALREGSAAGGTGGGLANFLRVQTGARSVTPRAGTDPDAILSRAGEAVGRGDIGAALTEIATLPPAARTAMEGWTGPATAWAEAAKTAGALKTSP